MPAVSQVMWNNKDRNLIPVHTEVYQAEEVSSNLMSSIKEQSSSSGHVIQHEAFS